MEYGKTENQACFLSFIVPVYNAEDYLGECLDSLLAQDFSAYEILCVNDGSTDRSAEILAEYQEKYPNLRVVHKKNGGVVSARNSGLENARGEFIWFVDADDLVRENILGTLHGLAAETGCDRIVMDGYTFTDVLTAEEAENARQGKLPCNVPWKDSVVWRSILRREFLNAQGLNFRYAQLTHGEDGVYMYEVAAASPKTTELPETTYFYRVHSGSAETGDSPETHRRKLRSYLKITEIFRSYYLSGRKDAETANKLMSYLWLALYEIAQIPAQEATAALAQLRAIQMFPARRLPECTLESTYLIGQGGIVGKVLDKICLNIHTRWGYAVMRTLLRLKHRGK